MGFKVYTENRSKIISYLIVVIIGIMTFFAFWRFDELKVWLSEISSMLFPFIFGFAVAFILDKPMMMVEKVLLKTGLRKKTVRSFSAIIAVIIGIAAIGGFLALIIPQMLESLFNLVDQLPSYLMHFSQFVENLIIENNIDMSAVYELFGPDFEKELYANVMAFFSNSLPDMIGYSYLAVNTVFNLVLGLMAGIYIMLEKEKFMLGIKKFTFAFFAKPKAEYLVRFAKITADVFNNFIIGKAIDSLIIGIICYILMTLFKMPYALLLSVIVGVLNMIPVFGPFIGAVPGVFILTIIHPMQGLYFALLILVIQQFDGNILGPIILGDKLGLPSLAILFSVVIGGGIFGLIGMFLGVPLFAVIYIALKEIVEERLAKKNIEVKLKD